jgi:hypothetical protein
MMSRLFPMKINLDANEIKDTRANHDYKRSFSRSKSSSYVVETPNIIVPEQTTTTTTTITTTTRLVRIRLVFIRIGES